MTGFWKIPEVSRSLTCAAMLVLGVWLADFCAVHSVPVPMAAALALTCMSLCAAQVLRRLHRPRPETAALLAAMMCVGVLLWTVRNPVDAGEDVARVAASAEFYDVPALRMIGDVANIPALTMPRDGGGLTSPSGTPRTLLLLRTRFILRGNDTIPAQGVLRVLIDGDATAQLCWGDRIQLTGQIDLPEKIRNPGEFDYARHMRRRGMSAMAFVRHPAAAQVIRSAGI